MMNKGIQTFYGRQSINCGIKRLRISGWLWNCGLLHYLDCGTPLSWAGLNNIRERRPFPSREHESWVLEGWTLSGLLALKC